MPIGSIIQGIASAADVTNQAIFGGIGAGLGIADYKQNKRMHQENLQHQKDVLDYQKALQQQIFAREDNAIARRVKDLEASGFSKFQALGGSGAGAGAAVPVSAPQRQRSQLSNIMQNVSLPDLTGIAHTMAQTEHLKNQDKYLQEQKRHMSIQTKLLEIDAKTRGAQNQAALNLTRKTIDKVDKEIANLSEEYMNLIFQGDIRRLEIVRKHIENVMELREALIKIRTGQPITAPGDTGLRALFGQRGAQRLTEMLHLAGDGNFQQKLAEIMLDNFFTGRLRFYNP